MANLYFMRSLVALLVLGSLLAPMQSSAAPIGVKREQSADAFWMVPTETRNHFIGYYAAAHLDEPGGGEFSWDAASVGKGRCVRERTKHGSSTSCWFRSWATGKASESFSMDPLMQSAELELHKKGETFHVMWSGEDFGFYQSQEGCMGADDEEPREGFGGGLIRFATAQGHVFGEHLVSKGTFGAMMLSGAMVTECTRARALAGLQPGERLHVTL